MLILTRVLWPHLSVVRTFFDETEFELEDRFLSHVHILISHCLARLLMFVMFSPQCLPLGKVSAYRVCAGALGGSGRQGLATSGGASGLPYFITIAER